MGVSTDCTISIRYDDAGARSRTRSVFDHVIRENAAAEIENPYNNDHEDWHHECEFYDRLTGAGPPNFVPHIDLIRESDLQ